MLSAITSFEPPRVLLVDDNDALLTRAATALTGECVVIGCAADGLSALLAAAELEPDVIVLDISMPGMSGLDVAARLRETGSGSAVVFLTVHEEEEFVRAARSAGGVGFVVKARLVSDLVIAVREAHAGRPFVSPRRPRP